MSGKHSEPDDDASLEALKAGTNSRRSAVAQERIATAFERIALSVEAVSVVMVSAMERDRLREEAYSAAGKNGVALFALGAQPITAGTEATQRAASAPGDRVPTEAEMESTTGLAEKVFAGNVAP